jgi:PI4-kinase N-terminal region
MSNRQCWPRATNMVEGNWGLLDTIQVENATLTEPETKNNLLDKLSDIESLAQRGRQIPEKELHDAFILAGTHLYASQNDEYFLVRKLVSIPFKIFKPKVIEFGISIWVWISHARSSVHSRLLAEISKNWEWSLRGRKGLFNSSFEYVVVFRCADLAPLIPFRKRWNINRRICTEGQNANNTYKRSWDRIY